jgi:precorrin-2 dehydrogenase / sirohydrochlorin ferrochelatase
MTTRYPIFLDVERKPVLIVGGGSLALQKLTTLQPSHAVVTIIAPELRGQWPDPAAAPGYTWVRRRYEPGDLTEQRLVFAATDDPEVNHRIVAEARERGILANAVDDPAWCDFYTPAVVRRGRVTLAVSTDGGFPGVSRAVRETLEEWLPEQDDALIDALFALRTALRQSSLSARTRSAALRTLVANFKREYLTPRPRHPKLPERDVPVRELAFRDVDPSLIETFAAVLVAQHG